MVDGLRLVGVPVNPETVSGQHRVSRTASSLAILNLCSMQSLQTSDEETFEEESNCLERTHRRHVLTFELHNQRQ